MHSASPDRRSSEGYNLQAHGLPHRCSAFSRCIPFSQTGAAVRVIISKPKGSPTLCCILSMHVAPPNRRRSESYNLQAHRVPRSYSAFSRCILLPQIGAAVKVIISKPIGFPALFWILSMHSAPPDRRSREGYNLPAHRVPHAILYSLDAFCSPRPLQQ